MKVCVRVLSLLPCAAFLFAATPIAHAQITSAVVYENTPDASNSSDPANFASTLPNATFTIGSLGINYNSNVTGYTVGQFLNSPTFTNEQNGFDPTDTADNSELVISGEMYLNATGNTFAVSHDDGFNMAIPGDGGFTFSDDGPTSSVLTTFSIPNPTAAGEYAFTFDYSECCGAPAVLEFEVNGSPITSTVTPEPSSLTLMGTGLLAFAGMVRRRILR